MPTYTVLAPAGLLSNEQKNKIAREVTRTHNEITGAQTFFAQVLFVDVADGNWFLGGAPLESKQIYIYGYIRSGRSDQTKRNLTLGLRDALAAGAAVPKSGVWSYILELPPTQMAEYGHVLPEPGMEASWLAELPPEDRAVIKSVGRRA